MRTTLLLILILAPLPALDPPARAQEIPIPNARLTAPKRAAHGSVRAPADWTVEPADAEVQVWRPDADGPTGAILAAGTTIRTSVAVPALTEVEAGVCTWRVALAVDVHRVGADLPQLVVALDGTRLRALRGPSEGMRRHWIVLESADADALFGRTVELAVSAEGRTAIDDIRMFRLPDRPTKKLFGKPNGKLGPDGLAAAAYGFDALMLHGVPFMAVLDVRPDSAAALAKMEAGDIIVAMQDVPLPDGDLSPGWNWYERSHETMLGRCAQAGRTAGVSNDGRTVKLELLHGTKTVRRFLKAPRDLAFTSPLRTSKGADALRADVFERVVETQRADGSWKNNPIHTAFGGLALLSAGDPAHAERIRAAADWCLARIDSPKAGWFWHNTYLGIFLSEYHLATGDERVLPAIAHQLAHVSSSTHTSKWGTTTLGHGPKGLPYGNKSLVALTTHILVFEALAERCGVEGRVWTELEPYMMSAWSDPAEGGHGGLGYNASHKDKGEFWSRSGLFALALHLRDEQPRVREGLVGIMHERHPWIRNSHAYGEPGGAWGLIALAAVAPEVYDELLDAYAWWFSLAWQPGYGLEYTTPHMGAPYMEGDELINNAYAVVLTAGDARLALTGRTGGPWLDVSRLPAVASAVHIRRTVAGDAELACVIPGAPIHYTTDGSVPARRSPLYEEPFAVRDGLTVKARSFGTGRGPNAEGPVAERTFGLAERGTVIASNGHKDPNRAVERAAHALDGNPSLYWVTEQGLDTQAYPFEVTIDLGRERDVRGVSVHYAVKETSPSVVRIFATTERDANAEPHVETRTDFTPEQRIEFPMTTARFLRIVFDAPMKEGATILMVGEIEVF